MGGDCFSRETTETETRSGFYHLDLDEFVGGAAIVLAGAVSLALGTVLIRRSSPGLSSTVRTAWALPVSAALLHALSLAAGESVAAATWTPSALLSVAYLGVFAGALAYILHFNLLDAVAATIGIVGVCVTPETVVCHY